MNNFPIKVDAPNTGDINLPAAEYNALTAELKNIVTSVGITLSDLDAYQLSKAVAIYCSGGDFYTDSGSANSYVLGAIGNKKTPPAYFNGMRVRFQAGINNTGASTVNVATLGVKSIKRKDGSDLAAFDLVSGQIIELCYFSQGDYFIFMGNYDERYYTKPEVDDRIERLFPTNRVTYCANSGNVNVNGYADIISNIEGSETSVSFKVGSPYDNLVITFPNGKHYEISSIADVTGLNDDGTYNFVVYEENLTALGGGLYSAVVTAIKLGYISNEVISSQDNAIDGGNYSTFYSSNAFDSNLSTQWWSSQSGSGISGNAYIGQSSLTSKVTSFDIIQGQGSDVGVTSVKVQFSNDGSSWTDIQTSSITATVGVKSTISVVDYTPSVTHYVRLLANSNLISGYWVVQDINFYNEVSYTGGNITEGYTYPEGADGDLTLLINQNPMKPQLRTGGVWTDKQFVKIGEATKATTLGTPISYAYNGEYASAITSFVATQPYLNSVNIGSEWLPVVKVRESSSCIWGLSLSDELPADVTIGQTPSIVSNNVGKLQIQTNCFTRTHVFSGVASAYTAASGEFKFIAKRSF